MGGPGSGPRPPMRPPTVDPIILASRRAEDRYRKERGGRMEKVRRAQHRETCILHSRTLWMADGVMLPLVLRRWQIHEDEIRQAVRRPEPEPAYHARFPYGTRVPLAME